MIKIFKIDVYSVVFAACAIFSTQSNAQWILPETDAILTTMLAEKTSSTAAEVVATASNWAKNFTAFSQVISIMTGLTTMTQNALLWNDRMDGRITKRDTTNDPGDKTKSPEKNTMSAPVELAVPASVEYGKSEKIEKYINQSGIGKNDKGLIKRDNLEFLTLAQQVSLNRAAAENSYGIAIDRVPKISSLYKSIFDVVGAKEAAEVSSIIQANLLETQNEANTIATLSQLSRTQQDMQRVTARGTSVQRKVQGLVGGW